MGLFATLCVLLAGQALALPAPTQELDPRGWPDITTFLGKVAAICPVKAAIQDICGTLTFAEQAMATLFNIPITENDGCGDVTVIFARGTCDAGNVGVFTGPWFFKSLEAKLKPSGRSLAVNGYDYPAGVDGYLTNSNTIGAKFANTVKETLAKCPNTKLVVSGYSQGAMVVHDGAEKFDADTVSKTKAVVLFGDPFAKKPVANIDASKIKTFCHAGDNICENGPIITFEHLNYGKDADAAADFVISKL